MKDLPTLIGERLTQNLWGVLGNQGYILGIDLGSYGLRVALVDLQHHTYQSAAIESVEHEDPETTVNRIIELARGLMAQKGWTVIAGTGWRSFSAQSISAWHRSA